MATNDEVREDLGSEPGFISPVNFPKKSKQGREVIVVADTSLRTIHNTYGGANKLHRDMLNLNIDRDYKADYEGDIAMAQPGMRGPHGGKLVEKRGIEVGNIFQLGYHYTTLMHDAEFTTETGKRQKYYMGCYGIGIGRTLAAIVETHHDDKGIIWPARIAPYQVYLARLGESDAVKQQADELYEALVQHHISVIYDDRDVRAGEKFTDADLLGIPHRVVVSEKTAAQGQYEYKQRTSPKTELYQINKILAAIQ